MRFRFSKREIFDLVKAWVVLSVAFGIVLNIRGDLNFFASDSLFYRILSSSIVSAITVGIGFLFHESAHKYVAQKYGHFAEFYASDTMLLLALVMSPLGFIIALPGAVMISGMITRTQNGKIALAGPVTNFVLAIFFALVFFISKNPTVSIIAEYGYMINTWLGLFNVIIPIWEFDGRKILDWSKKAYFITLGVGIILFLASSFIFR